MYNVRLPDASDSMGTGLRQGSNIDAKKQGSSTKGTPMVRIAVDCSVYCTKTKDSCER